MKVRIVMLGTLLFGAAAAGCKSEAKGDIVGLVSTRPGGQTFSTASGGIKLESGEVVVEGVRVLLALDEKGTELVQGTEAVTDKDGNYRISMKGVPAPKDGGYYLVFIKEGYERFIVRVKLGPWSALQENTISLKKISDSTVP
jgi:hypothetical protein